MSDPLQIKPDRNFAPLLATSVVLLGGVTVCLGIMYGSGGDVQPLPVAITVGVGLGMGILLWSLRDRPQAQRRSWFAWVGFGQSRKQRLSYEMRIVHPKVTYGDKQPPTLEELREIQDATRTWVPAAGRTNRRPTAETDS